MVRTAKRTGKAITAPIPTGHAIPGVATPAGSAGPVFRSLADHFVQRKADGKVIEVDLKEQRLVAREGEQVKMDVACVCGADQTPTPAGSFRIGKKSKNYVNRNGTKMPFSLFFDLKRGIAIHQGWHPLTKVQSFFKRHRVPGFGYTGSHGCVRLQGSDAETLYAWTPEQTPVQVR